MNINKETSLLLGKQKNGFITILKLVSALKDIALPFFLMNINPSFSLVPVKKDKKNFLRK
jgi:hypothetical protein